MEDNKRSVFETLNEINVSEHIEKKDIGGGRVLSYVSWVWAWSTIKKLYPDASYKVYESPQTGLNYFDDGRTAYVKCGVTINGEEIIEYLPVMTGAQKSMPLDKVTSHDVTRSIQRCVTKAIARHGLGLYVYAGEDLPEKEAAQKEDTKIFLMSQIDGCKNDNDIKALWGKYKNMFYDDQEVLAKFGAKRKEVTGKE